MNTRSILESTLLAFGAVFSFYALVALIWWISTTASLLVRVGSMAAIVWVLGFIIVTHAWRRKK